ATTMLEPGALPPSLCDLRDREVAVQRKQSGGDSTKTSYFQTRLQFCDMRRIGELSHLRAAEVHRQDLAERGNLAELVASGVDNPDFVDQAQLREFERGLELRTQMSRTPVTILLLEQQDVPVRRRLEQRIQPRAQAN